MATTINKTALLPHSAQTMFDLVADIARYPEFLPGCSGAEIIEQDNVEEDAVLLILNSHNNVSKRIKFNGIFPTSLDSLDFNTQNESLEYLQATVSFKYTNFEIE